MKHNCNWAVIATCTAKNGGKYEDFERVTALFDTPIMAEDFINKCLPKETRARFRVERIDK